MLKIKALNITILSNIYINSSWISLYLLYF